MTDTTLNDMSTSADASTTRRAALIFAAVAVYLALWATAVIQFGVLGLYIPALVKVPVVFGLLLLVTRG